MLPREGVSHSNRTPTTTWAEQHIVHVLEEKNNKKKKEKATKGTQFILLLLCILTWKKKP